MATLEGSLEGKRKTNGETTDNHKKLKLRIRTGITDGQVKQAIDNPTHSTDKPSKGKLVSSTTGMTTEAIKPESNVIVENQRMMAPITDLVSASGKCKPEEQSGRIGKIRSVRNHGRRTIQNGMIAVNQGNLIPRLTRSKTADQALQAPNNLTLPTDKPWE
eukprot:5803379-Ditylum_brightwellii.AAC.1